MTEPFSEGPFVRSALFCERVIDHADGSSSIIQPVDLVEHSAHGPAPPAEMPPFQWSLVMVVTLYAGTARGRFTLEVVHEPPSGIRAEPAEISLNLEPHAIQQVNIESTLQLDQEGRHLFDVYFDGKRLTRIPLVVRYDPQTMARK